MKIFGEVWESERVPVDFLKGLITIIPNKGDTSMICSVIRQGIYMKGFSLYVLPEKYVRVIRYFYSTVSTVRHDGELSRWVEVVSGTGKGDMQGVHPFSM